MGEACSRVEDWKIYAAAVLSFATLCRVGEISSLRRSNISKMGITFQGIKRNQHQVTRRLGPYAQAWASWLRRIAPGEAPEVGRAAVLEMGMAQLLQWSERCAARWNSRRRAGATYLRWLGLPWRHLLWWGRWHNIKIAHLYASPPDEFECLRVARLPWPGDEGIRWRKTYVRDLWPPSITELFEAAAGERVLHDGVILWEPLHSFSMSFTQFHDVVATPAQSGVLPGVTIKVHGEESSEQITRAAKKQKVQDRKQQLAVEAKQVIAKLETEGWTLAFTDAKQHPKVGWVAGYGCVVMGVWETKGFLPPNSAQTNNRAELLAVITVLEYFLSQAVRLVVVMGSQYVYDVLRGAAFRWRTAGWVGPSGPVRNVDLWIKALDLVDKVSATCLWGHRWHKLSRVM